MSNLKQYNIDKSSFIGGWYMPENVCDELIETYNNNSSKIIKGELGQFNRVNTDIKDSNEFVIQPNEYELYLKNYMFHLSNITNEYKKLFPFCDEDVERWYVHTNVKIQHYKPGGGFKKWHCENSGYGENKLRHLVFMTYLDTIEYAGTEFYHQSISTPCHKGLTLIWPAGWTHIHRGVINNTKEKMIITGWFEFYE
tara:strand:- start:242 stop:832 length:591 start_codon:yes stop_codon:yes gene_type:complete